MLLIPGPVEVPFSVANAGSYVVNHRSREFREIMEENQLLLNKFSGAYKTVMVTGSGTLAVETMVFSLIKENERVLSISYGDFGERLIESISRRTKNTQFIKYDMLDMQSLLNEIRNRDYDKLFLVHNETSNGTAIRDISEIIKIVHGKGARLLVDDVSGFGGYSMGMEGIYAMVTGSQKNIAAIPGIGIIFLSREACDDIENTESVNAPFYLDLKTSLRFLDKNETAYTPATGAFKSMNMALKILDREGFLNRVNRIEASSQFIRDKLTENGVRIFGNKDIYSNTVVCFYNNDSEMIKKLLNAGISVSKGMGSISGNTLRIGTMGLINNFYIGKFLNTYFKLSGVNKTVSLDEIPEATRLPAFLIDDVNLA
ncbi:MAG: aminotransferase class V-fold PLP-dependent enzyme [Ferroplasma sp.]|uniref:pyridoxal-phosphate-dependent aminotransferase family protein n=1 Tax=Ferroplasma sp. TaxID=2591003 RepID=UPI002815F975|nr:aminotransferase class V-fold PLP-dependent enzyme [Ferroplasma sp.]WMT51411.1 MAG: aminotransferase class V-fold PLP-dependent enzyme [Ferroplasma sp.]